MRSLLALSLLFAACTDAPPPERQRQRQHLPVTDDPTFTLYVSNQSFELPQVDLEIRIDGQLAVTGDFPVEGQHSFFPFDFELAPGPHQLRVTSRAGGVTLEETFELDARKWGNLFFWYYPSGSSEPTPPQFTFQVLDEEPLFL